MSDPDGGSLKDLVNALVLIQCFGNEKQVDIAKESLQSVAVPDGPVINLGDLLSSLREDFRKELSLSLIDEPVALVRRTKKS